MSENETNSERAAKEYGIKVSKPKGVPVSDENNVISSSETNKKGGKKTAALRPSTSGVISSAKADLSKKPKEVAAKKEIKKIAIFSNKNARWPGVGEIGKGYNIVSVEAAERWLTRDHVREATPEEIAQNFER